MDINVVQRNFKKEKIMLEIWHLKWHTSSTYLLIKCLLRIPKYCWTTLQPDTTVSFSFSHQTRWGTWSIRWHSVVSTLSYSSGLHLYTLLLEQWLLHTWLIDSFNQWINVLSLANHSWKNSFGKTWFQKWEKTKNLLVGGEFGKIPIMITVLPK